MRGGHDSVAGVRSRSTGGNSWPTGADAWVAYAADVVAAFPLAGTDWDQHSDAVEAGFYNVRKRTETSAPAAEPNCENADLPLEEPLSPEYEETLF